MKTATIHRTWMDANGYRLDCQPYVAGTLEIKMLLERLPLCKDPLHMLTKGFNGGIYNGPQFSRTYVESPEYGVPFVGSSSMLYADLSYLPLLSKREAYSLRLRHLELKQGMSLISCSGTIGKTVYTRPDMVGMWSSQDIMKVVPNPEKIASGYLYAFLSSKFGVPLVASGTYGSIIQHLEPSHIADLPVPRLGDAIEQEIHELVEEAARLRTRANEHFQQTLLEFEQIAGLPPTRAVRSISWPLSIQVSSSKLNGRLDTNLHGPKHYAALQPYTERRVKPTTVGHLAASVFEPVRFKRIEHTDAQYSVALYGTGDIGNVDPQPISQITAFSGYEAYRVSTQTVLIPRSGQLYGIIGTATFPIGGVRKGVVSEHAIRVNCRSEEDAGYIYLALRSQTGLLQLKARAFGGSIPTLDVLNVAAVLVPELSPLERKRFGAVTFQIATMRTEAIDKESRARDLVVGAIEAAGKR